ncbi:splicing factor U2AF 26 kDa subunit isoform X2 [Dipodomys spectabilis]|uniref:splicing factor U2AF 26 kDa subunit isoform X2 n=1 Tax=Dipodomys spectabilis TaxID=105255 RepID=UPI001C548F47|nr:splicing factor U2AF 26 kDa subunit isoform X2 [Dipodomys spectabilis]
MAEYLASIFGTEKDKVNCSFYFKIGACRHGDRCSRLHNKPTFSQTIVLLNLYRNPQNTAQTADGSHCHVSDVEVQEHYDNFFEEVFTELQENSGEKKMQIGQWLNSITVGSMDRLYMLNCLLSLTSGSHAAVRNVPVVASVISCTFDPYPGTCAGSCMAGGPGADHPHGPMLATVPEKGTAGILQTTAMAASETLAPCLRDINVPGQDPFPVFTLLSSLNFPLTPGLHPIICSTQGPSPNNPLLIKFPVSSRALLLPACGL